MGWARLVSQWRLWWAPALLVIAGFSVRAAYYRENYGHPDEPITVEVVKYMRRSGDWDTNWAKTNLEAGLRYDQYNFSSHLYATYFFYRLVKWTPGIAEWVAHAGGFWVYRFFSVLLASVAVWQTWALARRVGGEIAAGLAAALAIVTPLLVQDAHYMRPEAFVTVLTLAAVGLGWPGGEARLGKIFGASVVVGLSVACKVSMLGLGWLPMLPILAAGRGEANAGKWKRAGLGALLTLAGVAAGFALGAPGALLHPEVFRHGVEHLAHQYAGLHPPYSHVDGGPVWGMAAGYFRATLGWAALGAGAAGLAVLLARRRWWESVALAGPVVLFVGYFSTRSVFFERNLSHVLPLFCVLAGVGAAAMASWVARRLRQPVLWVAIGLGAVVCARPAELTRRLLWIEFSGREAVQHEAFEAQIKTRYPDAGWWIEALMNEEPLSRLETYFKNGGAPIVMRVIDYHDEWTARYGPRLPERFDAELIAQYASEFADVPGCTLHTYNSWSDRYYLVRGVKSP